MGGSRSGGVGSGGGSRSRGAAAGARPYAGCWNDGSRLAAVESLLARGTLAIDGSIFVEPPPDAPPYAPGSPANVTGTYDKLYIGGHYYSDKPAVVTVLMAAAYWPLMWLGAPAPGRPPGHLLSASWQSSRARRVTPRPSAACGPSGGASALAPRVRLGWLAAFAFATVAPAYTRQVNNHIMQLAVLAGMCALLARAAATGGIGGATAAGLGHAGRAGLQPGSGKRPASRGGRGTAGDLARPPGRAGAGVHARGAAVGGGRNVGELLHRRRAEADEHGAGIQPVAGVPVQPPTNMTGFSRYGPVDQVRYCYCLLFGTPGFVTHNLPLWLAAAAGWGVLRKPFAGRAELLAALAWCAATWLLYGLLSNNYSGKCVSIRWFVPFLAPGFWLLAVVLRGPAAPAPAVRGVGRVRRGSRRVDVVGSGRGRCGRCRCSRRPSA